MDDTPPQAAQNNLPDELIAEIQELDSSQLQDVSAYVQDLIRYERSTVTDLLDGSDEQLVSVEEKDEYIEVIKKQAYSEGQEDRPQDLFVYHVTREAHRGGSESLHWSFIGKVRENAEI